MNAIINYLKCLFHLRGCKDVHKLLFDYVQGNLDAPTAAKLTKHLDDCPLCVDYVDTYRKTIAATREHCHAPPHLPAAMEQKLKEFVAREL